MENSPLKFLKFFIYMKAFRCSYYHEMKIDIELYEEHLIEFVMKQYSNEF